MPEPLKDHDDWVRTDHKGGVYIGEAHVTADDLNPVVQLIYRVSGVVPPIMLEPLEWYGSDRTAFAFNGVHVRRDGKSIHMLGNKFPAATARGVARVLAEMADHADDEPDPAELERLSGFLDEAMDTDPETLARRLLRHFEFEERAA